MTKRSRARDRRKRPAGGESAGQERAWRWFSELCPEIEKGQRGCAL